jgi:hypothetical protein
MLQGDTNLAGGPEINLDQTGRAIVAWTDFSTGLWSTTFNPSEGWGSPAQVEAGANFGTLRVAMNPGGAGVFTWFRFLTGGSAEVLAKRFTLDNGPQATVRLDASDPRADFANSYLGAAVDALGDVTATWIAIGVYTTRFEGGRWSQVETLSPGPASSLSIAMDPTGNAVAAWEEDNQGESARFQPLSGWRSETYDVGPNEARSPVLSVDSSGGAVLAWNRQPQFSTSGELWTRQAPITGPAWGVPQQIAQGGVISYAMAGSQSGNRVRVWQDSSGLSAVALEPGATWSTPIHLPNTQFRDGPAVGVDGSGNAIVVWTQWNGSNQDEVWADRFSPGVGWGQPARIDAGTDNRRPQVVVDSQGNAWAVWAEFRPPYRIWASRFEIDSP